MTSRRTRIARIIARLNVGGPARHVVWLTEALNNEEFETVLVAGTVAAGEEDMSDFAAAHGVKPLAMREMSREISPRDAVTVWKLYRFFRRYRPDIIHTHTAKAGAVGRVAGLMYRFLTPSILVGRPRRCRFIHTYHGHIFHSYYGKLKTSLFLLIERALARLTRGRLIVLSQQQFDEIHGTFGVGRREQFTIVPLGIDLHSLRGDGSSLRRDLGIDDHELVVAIVGRLTAIKNHDLFLRVAARLRHEARFVIFGEGTERALLERRASELGLGERVIFAGTRDPAGIYDAVDIVALTSLNEGTPLALIEAMACGRPVISTAVGGVVDLLGPTVERVSEDGATYEIRERGVAAASQDERGLAAGLVRLLRDEPLRSRLATAGRDLVVQTYSKDRLIADIIALSRALTA